jgi:deoxyadenosine/deoxycytidine kinase
VTESKQDNWPHRLVVVEGLIGVGKTSLARKLAAAVGAGTVLEQPMENPFLERFYKDRKAAAFPAQLYFLFQRARQLSELRQHDLFAERR